MQPRRPESWVSESWKCISVGGFLSPFPEPGGQHLQNCPYTITGYCSLQTTLLRLVCFCSTPWEQNEASCAISVSNRASFCGDLYSGLHCSLRRLTATEFKPVPVSPLHSVLPSRFLHLFFLGMSASLYIFPLKSRIPTLLFLTLRLPTQSHVGCLPAENCIQQSSVSEGVKWGMLMCNN